MPSWNGKRDSWNTSKRWFAKTSSACSTEATKTRWCSIRKSRSTSSTSPMLATRLPSSSGSSRKTWCLSARSWKKRTPTLPATTASSTTWAPWTLWRCRRKQRQTAMSASRWPWISATPCATIVISWTTTYASTRTLKRNCAIWTTTPINVMATFRTTFSITAERTISRFSRTWGGICVKRVKP